MPVKGGRIGDHAKRIVMHINLALHVFNDHAPSSSVGHPEMNRRDKAELRKHDLADSYPLDGLNHLSNIGACSEQERGKLLGRQGLRHLVATDRLIGGVVREVKRTDVQPLFIDPICHKR